MNEIRSLPFRPIAGKHAIEVCIATVRFTQPTDPETFEEIRKKAASLARVNDLPREQQIVLPQMLLNIGVPIPQNFGVSFQRYAANGDVEAELRCEQNAITFQVRSYDRWSDFLGLIDRIMLPLVLLYTSKLPAIHSVTLQYDDRFLGGDPSSASAAGEMFRTDTRWLTVHDLDSTEAWHSHFGMFTRSGEQGRELVNVNVTVNDHAVQGLPLERSVGLTILVGAFFDVPEQFPLIVEQSAAETAVRNLLIKNHNRHRAILDEVLAEPYLEAIGAGTSA